MYENRHVSSSEVSGSVTVADLFVSGSRDKTVTASPWEKVEIVRWLNGPYRDISTPEALEEILRSFADIPYQKRYTPAGKGECATVNPNARQVLLTRGLYTVTYVKPAPRSVGASDHVFLRFFPFGGRDPIDVDYSFNQFVDTTKKGALVKGPVAFFHDDAGKRIKQHGGEFGYADLFEGRAHRAECADIGFAVINEIADRLSRPLPA